MSIIQLFSCNFLYITFKCMIIIYMSLYETTTVNIIPVNYVYTLFQS
jgi:hypothetical protein